MKTRSRPLVRRSLLVAAIAVLVAVLTACTGRGGGYLPPQPGFTGQASFGFTFTCENGDLKIELAYNDKGANPLDPRLGSRGPSTRWTRCWNPSSASARTRRPRQRTSSSSWAATGKLPARQGSSKPARRARRRPRRYAASRSSCRTTTEA